MLEFVEAHAEVGWSGVGTVTVQTVSIQHDKNLLLSVAVDTTHGDVDVVVTVNDGHAGDVGRQYLLQVASTTVAYHLLSDKRCWHRHLVQVLGLV